MSNNLYDTQYNPDVLSCLANLSNDEVFTPPEIANAMLDLLPNSLWNDSTATFLDPGTKSGVFLREIVKRLDVGLSSQIPDREKRLNHILKNQVFGIAITSLTALLSRRSVYCSKEANSKFSICQEFPDSSGNIKFEDKDHIWGKNGHCEFCKAKQNNYDRGDELESYAYEFIHTHNAEGIFNMKFDVIIGNPPYQMNDGGGTGDSARPIYNLFVEQAIKLKPRYLSMIIPSRWMKGGKGLDNFRKKLMKDTRISYIYDFEDAKECFSSLNIDGGVCYFLWERHHDDKANFIFKPKGEKEFHSKRFLDNGLINNIIRDDRQASIIQKVHDKNKAKFSSIVSSRKPYGIATDLFNNPKKYGYNTIPTKSSKGSVKIFGVIGNKGGAKRTYGYIDEDLLIKKDGLNEYKLFQSYAYSTTATVPPEIILGEPGEASTETFLQIGPFKTKEEAENCLIYTKTKFYRALLFFNRIQKNLSQNTFALIPLESFKEPLTDKILYRKYGLSEQEINYIEHTIEDME